MSINFLKKIIKKHCRHHNVIVKKYYKMECNTIPTIKVYEKKQCKYCQKIFYKQVYEYSSHYYDLKKIQIRLERNHVVSAEKISSELSTSQTPRALGGGNCKKVEKK